MKNKLDKYEKELLKEFEAGEWQSSKNMKAERNAAMKAAHNFLKKNEKITIRLSHFDLERIRVKAAEDGLPYQSLISSVLHRFVTGRLTDTTI